VRAAILLLLEPIGGWGHCQPWRAGTAQAEYAVGQVTRTGRDHHPAVVRVVAELVREAGAGSDWRQPRHGGFQRVAEKSGIARAAAESGAELVEFNDTVELRVAVPFDASPWPGLTGSGQDH